ncbi:hypothetical protein BC829DRAFT_486361 [Chytridium lagenaria]|nr:hypothetical protein BC829DRAFT_486361 [Chytridium lagenaria]
MSSLSSLHLYQYPGTRSDRLIWLLHELSISPDAFTLHQVNIFKNEQHDPSFLAINPGARVPVLVDEDVVIAETLGRSQEFVPDDLVERAKYDQVIFAAIGHMDQILIEPLVHMLTKDEKEWDHAFLDTYKTKFEKNVIPTIKQELKGHDYAVGDRFTFADIVLGFTVRVAFAMKWTDDEQLKAYHDR